MTDHSSMFSHLLKMADGASLKSQDPSTKVGAALFTMNEGTILGWNYIPDRIPHSADNLKNRDWKYPRVIHAEMACLLRYKGYHSFSIAVTHFPCERCAAHLIEAGVQEIITRKPSKDFLTRWPGMKISEEMFMEAKIKLIYPES